MSLKRFKEKQKELKVNLREDCDSCGKPISGKGSNSLTSWIFQDSRCQCKKAQLKISSPAESKTSDDGSAKSRAHQPVAPSGAFDKGTVASSSNQNSSFPFKLSDRYEVLEVIGEGGMGTVYKARDTALDREFAVKVLHTNLAGDNAIAHRFEQECKLARDLTHPNLVAVYDDGISVTGAPFLVMDYIDGKTLAEVLSQEVFIDSPRASNLMMQICEAVAHAHAKGVVHRDLKPSNILLTSSENGVELAHVADFGIAKVLEAAGLEGQSLTQTGDIFGSPLYMSPEQCEGDKLDARSDIYSLGCVMYEMLTGKPPLSGANPVKTIMKHLREAPPPFPEHMEISKDLETIVMHCLEKDPALRYQSVDELMEDLNRVVSGKKPVAHAPSYHLVGEDSRESTEEEETPIHPSTQLWNKTYRIGAALISMVITLLLLFLSTVSGPVAAWLMLVIPLFMLGRTWQLQDEIRRASHLIKTTKPRKILSKLTGVLFKVGSYAVFEIPQSAGRKRRQYEIASQKKQAPLLSAAADGKLKEFTVHEDPDTGKAVALTIGTETFVVAERNPFGVCTRFDPLSVFIKRSAATLVDGIILSLPFALAYLCADPLASSLGLALDAENVRGISSLFMGLTVLNAFVPITFPVVVLIPLFGSNGGESPWGTVFVWYACFALILRWLYQACFDSSQKRGTPGKQLFGLIATTDSGERLSFVRATIGLIVEFIVVSVMVWAVGALIPPYRLTSPETLAGVVCASAILTFLLSVLRRKQQLCHDFFSFSVVRQKSQAPVLTAAAAILILGASALAIHSPGASFKDNLGHQFTNLFLDLQKRGADYRISKNPNNTQEIMSRARVQRYLQNFDESISDLQHVLRIEPSNRIAMSDLADCLIEKGDYDKARALLDKSIALKPTSEAYTSKAIVSLAQNMPAEAAKDLSQANKLEKSFGYQDRKGLEAIAWRMCGNEKAANETLKNSEDFKETKIDPAILYLSHQINAQELDDRTAFSSWVDRRPINRCIVALDLLQNGKRDQAITLLNELKNTKDVLTRSNPYYRAAMQLLKGMENEKSLEPSADSPK